MLVNFLLQIAQRSIKKAVLQFESVLISLQHELMKKIHKSIRYNS